MTPNEAWQALERAGVQSRVEAAMLPGGPLNLALEEVVTEAEIVAMDALGIPRTDDRGERFGLDLGWLLEQAAIEIAERLYQASARYLEGQRTAA